MKKNGILLTGAAARISQEVAVLDLLILDGLEIKQNKTLLAGYSSGSLNLLALNACFRDNSPLGWDEYYKSQILFSLKDKNVFELFPLTGKSILNTAPFRNYLNGILTEMQFEAYGDLPFKSFVIASQYTGLSTYWADNQIPGHAQLAPIDLFMASTAIPVLLPPQEIANTNPTVNRDFPDGEFVDGGSWGAFVNYTAQLQDYVKKNGVLEELHIISPMRETAEDLHESKKGLLKNLGLLTKLGEVEHTEFSKSFKIGLNEFLSFLHGLSTLNASEKIAENIYVSMPCMEENTGILSFGKQQATYEQTYAWLTGKGKNQLRMPIAEFIRLNN